MSEAQAERGIQQLYQETSVRDELIDEEAEILLKWGTDQVSRLAAQDLDDAAFDEQYSELIRLLTRMSRFAARRMNLSPDEAQTSMERIDASAQSVGLQPGGFLAQTAPEDIKTNLESLINYVNQDTPQAESSSLVETPAEPGSDSQAETEIPPEPPAESTETKLTLSSWLADLWHINRDTQQDDVNDEEEQ
ncbi:MAG: hypothetical protein K8L99_30540 [Anaerolineae bacterium]|nr:hypothetical protein [Anaerolineae bacterium]